MSAETLGTRVGVIATQPVIFLRAGHHSADPGACANGRVERDMAIQLRDMIAPELQALGFVVDKDNDTDPLQVDCNNIAAKCRPHDILLDIHFNAAGALATGVETYVPWDATKAEYTLGWHIAETTSQVTGLTNRLKYNAGRAKNEQQSQHGRLAVMRPNCINVLWEVCFLTNTQDLEMYDRNRSALSKSIALLIAQPHGV